MSEQRQINRPKIIQKGFTLIELLVVISIISMLMSIVLPSLNLSRELGRRVVCFSNIRQLTFAWNLYAIDNRDRFCSPDTFWNNGSYLETNYWVADGPDWPGNPVGNTEQAIENGALCPYTEFTLGIYKCKSDRSNFLRSYSVSGGMGARTGLTTNPSGKIVFVDASSNWEWIHGAFLPVDRSSETPQWLPWDLRHLQQITVRHAGGFNLSFGDFHCEYWKFKDPRTIRFANQEISADEASGNNPDIERLVKVIW
jgi:prepilin-type N-terminal cleavage/methylation domain-containing protein/prepilin-type processing-associated H-X9-DG protein